MKNCIRFCAGRPVTVIMVLGAALLSGGFALPVLPLDRFPEISYPRITVETLYPGMSAADVRSIVTIPLEDALSSVKGLERLRSVSRDGSSVAVLDFRWGTNSAGASALVREAIDAVYPSLPEGIKKPSVVPGEAGEEVHAIVAVASRDGDESFARNFADHELRARIRRIDGVGNTVLAGGENSEIHIKVDMPRLLMRGMEAAELAQTLAAETADIPAGSAREGDQELVVVSSGKPDSLEAYSRIMVSGNSGPLHLRDVAEIREEPGRRKSLFIYNSSEQTALEIYRRPGADPVRLSRDIKKVLDETAALFSGDVEISLVYDASLSIVQGARDLIVSALFSAAAVIAVLVFFIGRIRYSFLVSLSIPVSAAAALAVLALAGKSLNAMSLSGLALGVGMVSDTAVMVLDQLHRVFLHYNGMPLPDEISRPVASLSGSSFTSTATTAVVFIPILFLPGPLGALFGDMSIALVASITAGWLFAQAGLPALYRIFHKAGGEKNRIAGLGGTYRRFLRAALRRPGIVLLSALILSAGGIGILAAGPANFVPPEQAGEIEVVMEFPPGTDLKAAGREGLHLTRLLECLPPIQTVFGRSGAEDADLGRRIDPDYRKERLVFRCILRKDSDPEKALEAVREALESFDSPGAVISSSYPQDRLETLLGLSPAHTLAVRGASPEETTSRSQGAVEWLGREAASCFESFSLRPAARRPELRIFPDREALAFLGLSTARIAGTVYAATEGVEAGRLEMGGRPLEVRLSGNLQGEYSRPETLLEDLPVSPAGTGILYLGLLGRLERRESPAALARLDRSDTLYLDVFPKPGMEAALAKSLEVLSSHLPGISRMDESVFQRYRTSLALTLVLVLVLLYMTMGVQFESFILPAILMLTVPFALAGAGPALRLAALGLDSGSVLGLVVLFGLAVNNGIVLYEISGEKVSQGLCPVQAVYTGAAERFRPVLATTATTILAILPLALSPLGASQRSMALAMLGGMIASTLLTLFALPPVFAFFLRGRRS